MGNIVENVKIGDLKDTILPLVSVDEYESKISNDEDVIVISFFVNDELAADDLANFIDRSVIETYDADVSPIPNEEGYYLVFVEINRNKKAVQIICDLIDEVNRLCRLKKDQWKVKIHKKPIQKLDKKYINDNIALSKNEYIHKHLSEFFQHSLVEKINVTESGIELCGCKNSIKFSKFSHKISTSDIQLDERSFLESVRVQRVLGMDWKVDKFGNEFVLSKNGGSVVLIL